MTSPLMLKKIPFSLDTIVHPHSSGDLVWVKDWKQQTLSTPYSPERAAYNCTNHTHCSYSCGYYSRFTTHQQQRKRHLGLLILTWRNH